jgi:hypothetical protein
MQRHGQAGSSAFQQWLVPRLAFLHRFEQRFLNI